VRLEQRKTEQTNLCLLTQGLARKDPDYYTLVVLNAILGDSMSSRLFVSVREERGLAYDISTSPAQYHDTGAFVVYAGVEPRQAPAALEAILTEMNRMRREPVTASELSRAKEYTKGRMVLGLEDTHSVAWWLGGNEALLGEVRDLDDVLARVDGVTIDDVQRLAQNLFTDEWLRLAMIGPHRSPAQFEALLHL
jgi:predicted Zn-dependent peptidase